MPIACADPAREERTGPADNPRGRPCGVRACDCEGAFALLWRLALLASRSGPPLASVRRLSLILLSVGAMSWPAARQAMAQQIPSVPNNGTQLFALTGDLTQTQTVSLGNGATLTVNGNGHTLTLSNGAFFDFPQNPTAATLIFGDSAIQNITITGGNRSNGGAISGSNVASGTSISITGSATFLGNTATGNGGAIGFPNLNGVLSIGSPGSTAVFTGNTAQNGGAIDDANAAVALSGNATFSGNTATSGSGGAIHNTGGASVVIGDSSASTINFTGNTAAQNGGAVSAQNNSVTINGNNITLAGNMAGGSGGAIFEGSNNVTVGNTGSTVSITNNMAGSDGGAIWSQNTGVTINGADITLQQNVAHGNGGAIFENNGPVLIGDPTGATVNVAGNTAGSNGGAVYANNGSVTVNGNVTLVNNTATSGSGGAIYETNNAVLISNNGGNVNITGNTAGINGGAIYEGGGGAVMIGSSSATVGITTNIAGSSGGGIYSQNGPVTITGTGITIQGNGATAGNGGAIYEGGGAVMIGSSAATVGITGNMAGSSGGGIYSQNGPVTIAGSGITIQGNGAATGNGGAIYEGGGGAVMIGGSAATVGIAGNMAGSSGGGIYSQNGPVTITGNAIAIEGNGAAAGNGGAVYAGNGFTLNANGPATISSNGATTGNGGAVYLNSGNLNLNAAGGDIGVSGNTAGGLGGAIYLNGGNLALNATGGNIIFSGNTENGGAPNAIYFNNAGAPSQATFNTAAGQKISFFDPIESNGANGIVSVTKTGPGIVSFDGSQRQNVSNIFAQTTVQEGTFEVANGAVYGVEAPNTSFAVNPGAILQGGVAGTVAADQFLLQSGAMLNIAGNAPAGAPFSVFTVDAAQASFQSGSEILFNTELNDASVQHTDLLVLSHATTDGTGGIVVTNIGGAGGETLDRDGIRLVEATNGATTTPNNFTLLGEARAGAFTYDLFRGGFNPSNSPNDWFLRNTFENGGNGGNTNGGGGNGGGGNAGGGNGNGGGGGGINGGGETPPVVQPEGPGSPVEEFPSTPPTTPLPPNVLFPIIGPELATYGVVQPLARQLGLSILGTLDDRVGDTYEPDGCAVQPGVAPGALPTRKQPALAPCPLFSPSVWGRFFGQTINNRYQAFADPRANGNLGGFQGGVDLLRGPLIPGGYDRAGLYGAYGDVNADVTGLVTNSAATAYILTHTGSMNLTAWSGGAYWTHVGPGGWYLDTVLQGTSYTGSASTQFARLNTDGWGFIASLEGGAPFALPQLGPGFVLEPQGQILWQKVSFHHDYDGLGDVALGDTTGPSGRVGLRGKWTIVTAGGQVWQPYLRANLWRDWGAVADTVYSGTDIVPVGSQVTTLELGGGLTGRISANVSVFANIDYEFAVGAGDDKRNGVRGAFGARYAW